MSVWAELRRLLSGGDRGITAGGAFTAGGTVVPLQVNEDLRVRQSGVSGTYTIGTRGNTSYSYTLAAGEIHVFHGLGVSFVDKTSGSDPNCLWEKAPAGTFDGETASGTETSVTNQPNVNIYGNDSGTAVAVTVDASGMLASKLLDSADNEILQSFGNAGVAPATGLASALITANNTDVVTLSDGTATKNLVTGNGNWQFVQFPVVAGTTYTLAGTGLALLGGKILVGAG